MRAFELVELLPMRRATGGPWLEFLRSEQLSVGLYELARGAVDPQRPHSEDEVYYVVQGQAMIEVAGEQRAVQAGSIIFVGAKVPHRFHTIIDDLRVLVFFAPPEGSQST
jgi:mannose-6-phosphate isomerase-like protein (cupin superfamily)